ncbi:MAG: hypothetical protein JWM64_2988 [Frankiales bacterium]|nr:hypothetical protein [Frankiales bacterium]
MTAVQPDPPAPVRRDLGAEVEKHLGLVLTLSGTLLLITRVYIAGGRETGTSLALLRSAGLLPTVLGVVTTLLPALAVVVASGTALLALHDLLTGRRPGRGLLAAAVAVVACAFVPVEPGTLARAAALLALPVLSLLGVRGFPRALSLWAAAVVGVVGVNVLTTSAMWLPAERITVTGADGTPVVHVGYVLQEGGVLQVLNHAPRLVLQLKNDTVTERVLCRLQETDGARQSVLSAVLSQVDVGSPVSGSPGC